MLRISYRHTHSHGDVLKTYLFAPPAICVYCNGTNQSVCFHCAYLCGYMHASV